MVEFSAIQRFIFCYNRLELLKGGVLEILAILKTIKWAMVLNIFFTLIFFVLALKFSKTFLNHAFARIKERAKDPETTKRYDTLKLITINTINFLLFIFAVINILNQLGVDVRPIITAAGVLGVAVGFGSKRFVEDLLSGLTILLEGQIRVGDVICIQDTTGTVEKITLSLIVLRSVDGAVHYIRNGMVDMITNYTRDFSYALIEITVAYRENIAHVMDVLKDVGHSLCADDNYKHMVMEPVEILGLDKFNDSSISILLRLKTLPRSQWEVKRVFNLRVKEKFDELGIEIPFNQLVVTQNKD